MSLRHLSLALLLSFSTGDGAEQKTQPPAAPDLSSISPDLTTPAMTQDAPAAGKRVRQTTPGWEKTEVYHALYLPKNWKPGKKLPVLIEYPGNGGFRNKYGDVCNGTPEGCNLGYGLSAGEDYIWVCMPYVATDSPVAEPVKVSPAVNSPQAAELSRVPLQKRNAPNWWGDPQESVRYCIATVKYICREWGGDDRNVILCGFSRGSIGCNYIGLHNDEVAALWRGFICHSHYDGVRKWGYPASDRDSALTRLRRLNGRPQLITHEGSTGETRLYLESTGIQAPLTFIDISFRNHSDQWTLRDCEPRRKARAWLKQITETK